MIYGKIIYKWGIVYCRVAGGYTGTFPEGTTKERFIVALSMCLNSVWGSQEEVQLRRQDSGQRIPMDFRSVQCMVWKLVLPPSYGHLRGKNMMNKWI